MTFPKPWADQLTDLFGNRLDGPEREHPMPGQTLLRVDQFRSSADDYRDKGRETVADLYRANAVSSLVQHSYRTDREPIHRPVLDVDLPVKVIPSSTPGHFHLYIDKGMPWSDYAKLLQVLAEVGIIEHGYAMAGLRRKATAVRLPWIKK